MKQNSHFWEGKKTPKNDAKSTNLSSYAYNDVKSFSISFGCKIQSGSEVTSFQRESIKKGPFYVAKMKIQNLKAIISRTPGIFGTKTH